MEQYLIIIGTVLVAVFAVLLIVGAVHVYKGFRALKAEEEKLAKKPPKIAIVNQIEGEIRAAFLALYHPKAETVTETASEETGSSQTIKIPVSNGATGNPDDDGIIVEVNVS